MTAPQRQLAIADARSRAVRTFLQGLLVDVAVALAMLLLPLVTKANAWGDLEWSVMAFLMVKTFAVSALSYVIRRFVNGEHDPTPLPPQD